jgi:hypothetical protein
MTLPGRFPAKERKPSQVIDAQNRHGHPQGHNPGRCQHAQRPFTGEQRTIPIISHGIKAERTEKGRLPDVVLYIGQRRLLAKALVLRNLSEILFAGSPRRKSSRIFRALLMTQ